MEQIIFNIRDSLYQIFVSKGFLDEAIKSARKYLTNVGIDEVKMIHLNKEVDYWYIHSERKTLITSLLVNFLAEIENRVLEVDWLYDSDGNPIKRPKGKGKAHHIQEPSVWSKEETKEIIKIMELDKAKDKTPRKKPDFILD